MTCCFYFCSVLFLLRFNKVFRFKGFLSCYDIYTRLKPAESPLTLHPGVQLDSMGLVHNAELQKVEGKGCVQQITCIAQTSLRVFHIMNISFSDD